MPAPRGLLLERSANEGFLLLLPRVIRNSEQLNGVRLSCRRHQPSDGRSQLGIWAGSPAEIASERAIVKGIADSPIRGIEAVEV